MSKNLTFYFQDLWFFDDFRILSLHDFVAAVDIMLCDLLMTERKGKKSMIDENEWCRMQEVVQVTGILLN